MDLMQSTRNKLIELLADTQEKYISGQQLSDELNVSRNAIWKHMQELKRDGYIIEGIPRKGYKIISFPNKLSENTIQWGLNTKWLGQHIVHKNSTTSTQTIAHELAMDGAKHGTIVVADEQTAGKGRMNRAWHSSKGKGIWLSLILRPAILPHKAPQLTLLTATVLAHVISELGLQPYIKWPNDIIINNKKAAGILTEMKAEQDQIQYVVIGIGINVNQTITDLPVEIQNIATSLKIELQESLIISELIQKLLSQFEKKYEQFIQFGFQTIKEIWEGYGFKIGEMITIKTMHEKWTGQFCGIAEDGALLVTNKLGEKTKLYSAEIDWFKKGENGIVND
ncbi:biotin--[acetyl-CoA-carboxylase] ligase [Virgibacillus soli]